MTRTLLLTLLLALLLRPGAARAGEVSPPPAASAEEIAARLASTDPQQREQGEAMLVRALRVSPDRAALLERVAAVLRAPPAPARPSEPPAAPAPTAPAPPPPPGPATPQTPPPPSAPESQEAEGQTVADADVAVPEKAAVKATWTVRAWGVSVPERAVGAVTPLVSDTTGGVKMPLGMRMRGGPPERATEWVDAAKRAADAQPLGEATLALAPEQPTEVHLGKAVLYRCCAVQGKSASWAVETRTIPEGLSLRARFEGTRLRVEPSWVTIAQPMPTEQTRPAPGVDPIELDRPDWSVSRVPLDLGAPEAPGFACFFTVPGLLPDAGRQLVLVLEVRPVP